MYLFGFYFSSSVILQNLLQKVESRVRILTDLRELASAESLDTFTLIYTNILEHQPDCPVNLSVLKILQILECTKWPFYGHY